MKTMMTLMMMTTRMMTAMAVAIAMTKTLKARG